MLFRSGIIRSQADDDANIIFGVAFDEKLDDEMYVTVIATGFGLDANGMARKPHSSFDISSNSNFGADDDNMDDILDLFKGRR